LSTSDVRNQDTADGTLLLIRIPLTVLVITIWQRRRLLAVITGIGLLLALGLALLTPNEYQSSAELMPLDQQSLSNVSMLNALAGAGNLAPGMMGSLVSGRSPGATAVGILKSDQARDDLINRFDLRSVYHVKYYEDARTKLADRSTLEEDKTNGIISITVMDRDRYRARDLAQAYVEELNMLLNTMNTSSSHRERVFLEGRLQGLKTDLDASSRELSQFSSRNATLSPKDQGVVLFESAGRLQGQLIAAEGELSALKTMYSDDNVRVKGARANIAELQAQLSKMGRQGQAEDDKHGNSDLGTSELFPSIREMPLLGATYADLYRRVTMEEAIYETLTKQYEMAKVQEAKEIPSVKVLDMPAVPERKTFPHRSVFVLVGTLLAAILGILWIAGRKLWEMADGSHPIKTFVNKVWGAVRSSETVASN
jgi:uncharacterized protein involved in exopolysaccharide biosynthesis